MSTGVKMVPADIGVQKLRTYFGDLPSRWSSLSFSGTARSFDLPIYTSVATVYPCIPFGVFGPSSGAS